MNKTETMLIEIGVLCSAFESLVSGQNKKLLSQFKEICEKAKLEITEKDKRITELEKYEEKCTALINYWREEKIEAVEAVMAEIGLLIPPSEGG
jgi:hypothetical protein